VPLLQQDPGCASAPHYRRRSSPRVSCSHPLFSDVSILCPPTRCPVRIYHSCRPLQRNCAPLPPRPS
jgi:hypothetical protein